MLPATNQCCYYSASFQQVLFVPAINCLSYMYRLCTAVLEHPSCRVIAHNEKPIEQAAKCLHVQTMLLSYSVTMKSGAYATFSHCQIVFIPIPSIVRIPTNCISFYNICAWWRQIVEINVIIRHPFCILRL